MSQGAGDLELVIGYALKRTQAALRARMDEALRPLGLTVPQYVCLELLQQTPDISNSDLARMAFVTRQTMNTVLQSLQERGLVVRPDSALTGRARPTRLSAEGARVLTEAAERAAVVDERMVAGLTVGQRRELRQYLISCAEELEGGRER